MSQFCSTSVSFLEWKAISFPLFLSSNQLRYAAITYYNVSISMVCFFFTLYSCKILLSLSISTVSFFSESQLCSILLLVNKAFMLLNAFLYLDSHLNTQSFHINCVRSTIYQLQFFINHQQQLANPRNTCVSFTIFGTGYFLTTFIFSSSIFNPFLDIMVPRNITFFFVYSLFSSLR